MINLGSGDSWIFAHRGMWSSSTDQNSRDSINNAFQSGFAVETDIRDYLGEIVISHDPLVSTLELLRLEMDEFQRFALNLKSDGVFKFLSEAREKLVLSSSFLFDGSIPQMNLIKKQGLPHALRLSEYEREVPWKSEYLWIDGFNSDWWLTDEKVIKLMENGNCIFVSPELHGRKHEKAFDWFSKQRNEIGLSFSVCTDLPELLRSTCGD